MAQNPRFHFQIIRSKTLLQNGLVIHADGQKREDILLENTIISAVGDVNNTGSDVKVIDCKNRLIFSGIIDAHTHICIPIKSRNTYTLFPAIFPEKVFNSCNKLIY